MDHDPVNSDRVRRRGVSFRPSTLRRSAVRSAEGFMADEVLTLSAALSFYTLLSFAPLMVLAVWLASLTGPNAQAELLAQIGALAGSGAQDAAGAVIDSSKARPSVGSVAGISGLITLAIGATTVFGQLQSSLNRIFGIRSKPSNAIWSWLRQRVLSLGVVASFGFVLIVSLGVSTALGLMLPRTGILWDSINQAVTAVVFAILFGTLFRYLPDTRIPWRNALGGGLVTAVLFAIGKWGIGVYLASGDVGGAYGAAGSLALLLVWVYYSGAIFFFGAELTKSWLVESGHVFEPTLHGERRTGG